MVASLPIESKQSTFSIFQTLLPLLLRLYFQAKVKPQQEFDFTQSITTKQVKLSIPLRMQRIPKTCITSAFQLGIQRESASKHLVEIDSEDLARYRLKSGRTFHS